MKTITLLILICMFGCACPRQAKPNPFAEIDKRIARSKAIEAKLNEQMTKEDFEFFYGGCCCCPDYYCYPDYDREVRRACRRLNESCRGY